MKFSIIVPTRNRQYWAINAIKSCTLSRYENIEIIVTDVSDEDTLREDIKKLQDPRIKYFHHSKKLSMRDNWEYGVSKSSGDYVSIIGDDDALMPDGFLFAFELLKLSKSQVLHCTPPNYKWPDYPLINRRNYIGLKLPTTVLEIKEPQEKLRSAYRFEEKFGTGPGIYHGLVSRKFLNELKSKRGSFFVSEEVDFDSGICTVLYSDSYLETTYPIFLSGHCFASNSGAIKFGPLNNKACDTFLGETLTPDEIIESDLSKLNYIEAYIVNAMRSFIPEINQELNGEKIEFNKQASFDFLADGLSTGYDNTTFNTDVKTLKEIAVKWGVSSKKIPTCKYPAYGLIADKGVNKKSILREQQVNSIVIDGNGLNVRNIFDAINIIENSTTDWLVLLNSLHLMTTMEHPSIKRAEGTRAIAIKELETGETKRAVEILEENIIKDPLDAKSLLILGVFHFNEGRFDKALPLLSRSLSFEFSLAGFDAYFRSLISNNQYDFARRTLENYSANLEKINTKFLQHCNKMLKNAS